MGDEQVSRFVFDSNKLKAERLHWRAFWDPGEDVSVFRIQDLTPDHIWALSEADPRAPAVGRGDLSVAYVRQIELDVIASEPPDRHALIVGWPEFNTNEQRIQAFAKQLAAEAIRHARP